MTTERAREGAPDAEAWGLAPPSVSCLVAHCHAHRLLFVTAEQWAQRCIDLTRPLHRTVHVRARGTESDLDHVAFDPDRRRDSFARRPNAPVIATSMPLGRNARAGYSPSRKRGAEISANSRWAHRCRSFAVPWRWLRRASGSTAENRRDWKQWATRT